jgi:hypothetical protein
MGLSLYSGDHAIEGYTQASPVASSFLPSIRPQGYHRAGRVRKHLGHDASFQVGRESSGRRGAHHNEIDLKLPGHIGDFLR